jgi:succinyl-diaminopimelate desuccinylase
MNALQTRLTDWIDAHFDDEVRFLQAVVRIPTDTPPGNNAPHAEAVADMLEGAGWPVERHAVPAQQVADYGLESITNLIVRRPYGGAGPTLALNAHGDVVPPGEGWTHPPYGAVIEDGYLYGRAAAVSKSDFATYVFARSKPWARRCVAASSCTLPMTKNSAGCWGRAGCSNRG